MKKIGVVDYNLGNITSVCNSLKHLNINHKQVRHTNDFDDVSHIILPGVGSFGVGIEKLGKYDLIRTLENEVLRKGKFFLGICLGMQFLATTSSEFGHFYGLNFIPGKVCSMATSNSLPLPHIQWSQATIEHPCPIYEEQDNNGYFYFLHSYHFQTDAKCSTYAITNYGQNYSAIIGKDNIYGVQFHPEKSQLAGAKLIRKFSNL